MFRLFRSSQKHIDDVFECLDFRTWYKFHILSGWSLYWHHWKYHVLVCEVYRVTSQEDSAIRSVGEGKSGRIMTSMVHKMYHVLLRPKKVKARHNMLVYLG